MSQTNANWSFVDGDVPGDGTLWLDHPTQMVGWIDFRERPGDPLRRIMVATRGFVAARLGHVGNEATSTIFAAMLVVPDGSPAAIRASISATVQRGGLSVFAAAAPSVNE